MKIAQLAACAALAAGLSGCATVFDGTSQDITVATSPPDASCEFMRKDVSIGTVAHTPGRLKVKRTKDHITINCDKPGFARATYINHSGLSEMVVANVIVDVALTAGISSLVDSASGADNKYEDNVFMTLYPAAGSSAPPPPPSNPEIPPKPSS